MTKQRDAEQEYDTDSFWRVYYSTCSDCVTYKKRTLLALLCLLAFISFDSFSYEQCGVAGSSFESGGNIVQTYTLNADSPCLDSVIISGVEYAVLKTKSETSDGFTQLFTMTQNDYELLAKSFLILLAFAVSIKLVLRQLMPR